MNGVILDTKTLNLDPGELEGLLSLPIQWQLYDTTAPESTKNRIQSADVVLTNKVKLGENLKGSKVKYIGVLATGTNNIDFDFCEKQKIIVKNAAGYSTESVAQHTLGLMINLSTNQYQYISDCAKGRWNESDIFCRLDHPIFELSGKVLGLIGYGHIAKRVQQLAEAFGMQVLIAESLQKQSNSTNRTPHKDLLRASDFVSLHCPLTELTKNLVNYQFLCNMKPSAFLINTARGPIVNEFDLIKALEEYKIAGAAIDVLNEEPPRKSNPITSGFHKNLIVTPHNAWASLEARKKLVQITTENLREYIKTLV